MQVDVATAPAARSAGGVLLAGTERATGLDQAFSRALAP